MCTYATVTTGIDGSAKGPGGRWFHVTDGVVYFDHPAPADGPSARVAVELTAASARALIAAIQEALDAAPAAMTG